MPNNIPSSFRLHRSGADGEISYKVQAEVVVPGLFSSNLKHEQGIIVKELRSQIITGIQDSKEEDVTFLCCMNKGRISMTASADRDSAGPGEVCSMRVFIDNSRSQVDLREVRFHITRTIRYQVSFHTWLDVENVCTFHSTDVAKGTTADRSATLKFPSWLLDSTSGPVIQCMYHLVAELVVPWSPNLKIALPIKVGLSQGCLWSIH